MIYPLLNQFIFKILFLFCFLFKNQAIERELIEKIDKADLLQMTVDYLKNFQNGKYVKHNIFS